MKNEPRYPRSDKHTTTKTLTKGAENYGILNDKIN
jgi:hypothetical protein